jgi:hypothetical protein
MNATTAAIALDDNGTPRDDDHRDLHAIRARECIRRIRARRNIIDDGS